jgi:hypothetical protein
MQAGDTDRRAQGSADDCREEDSDKNVSGAVKSSAAIGKSIDKPCTEERLQGVAAGDAQRNRESALGGDIDQKCAYENSRPEPITPEQESC